MEFTTTVDYAPIEKFTEYQKQLLLEFLKTQLEYDPTNITILCMIRKVESSIVIEEYTSDTEEDDEDTRFIVYS